MSAGGRVTLPKEVRDHRNLRAGDLLVYTIDRNDRRVILWAKNRSVRELHGMLYRPGQRAMSIGEMDEGIAQGIVERFLRSTQSGHKSRRR